ncbi:transcriptional regulator family: C2H2 zinc finger [Penicillium psychrosexuale]|uniref:transcriptional regulator family: C2H2 zinc finger n=1 Tax=Penicillium psychrosexuale TaxID=1002107 RepID=UPI0025457A25|nr:transcriptional regulator family: C2H2 zinc finger [Penicillium psychrosexuale]KAJ5781659.1 transcriptional regulator family: C2H2 zinc finger [Penicillium psychrosexuale]
MARKSTGRISPKHIVSVLNSPAVSSYSSEPRQLAASNMVRRKKNIRPNLADATLPVTYTPTTHRISKAKKGKRVHACQYPACGKVFTRAEHRRRHELNHNPEASYRCATEGCNKAFHRADLLVRHLERHELESKSEKSSLAPNPITESPVSPCMSMDHGIPLAATSHSHSMSIGALVAPGIHPDLANNDCSLLWSGIELPLQPRPAFHSQLPESVDDSPFYSSPAETCPSPLSDATFSLPPYSSSSISSAGSVIDQYPSNIVKSELTSSPLQMHTPLRWSTEAGMPPSDLVPMSMGENMIQPVQCHYPSPSWSSADCLPYDDQVHSMHQFQPVSWAM